MENITQTTCKHMRSKDIMVPDFTDPDVEFGLDQGVQHYWCFCTMTTAGPDNDFVAPETCKKGRACFVAE
ncbi:MAG: hypothetical protein DWQ10_08295 [Calditrichaeota bacterium]|nr:MAG: hypothetical protein DWQ10_08295 [Calditrichota bacterium]